LIAAKIMSLTSMIEEYDAWHAEYFLAFTMNATSGELGRCAVDTHGLTPVAL
jgi:hypothetical protein